MKDVAVALTPSEDIAEREEGAKIAQVNELPELEPPDPGAVVELAGEVEGTIASVAEARAEHHMHEEPTEPEVQSPLQNRWIKRRQAGRGKDEDSSPEILPLDDPVTHNDDDGHNSIDTLLPTSALEPASEPQAEMQSLPGRRRTRGGAGRKKKEGIPTGGERGTNDFGAAVSTAPLAEGPRRVWEGRAHRLQPEGPPAAKQEVLRTWRPRPGSAPATSPVEAKEAVTVRRASLSRDLQQGASAAVSSSRREWRPGVAQVSSIAHGASPRPAAKAGKAPRGVAARKSSRGARPGSPQPRAVAKPVLEKVALPAPSWRPSLGLSRHSSP